MFLIFKDKSAIANWGLELGHSNMKFMNIPDELLEILSSNFLRVFKQIMKKKQYNGFKTRKRKPSDIKEINLESFLHMEFNINEIHIKYEHTHNLIREYRLDIEKASSYYKNRPDTTTP